MLTLAIEISNPSASTDAHAGASVAIGHVHTDARVELLGVEAVQTGVRDRDDLLPAIDRLARRVNIGPRDIRRIAVSVGPGGFTGVRMGVAAAKMIAWTNDAQCVAVPSSLIAAQGVRQHLAGASSPMPSTFIVALASKHDSAWLHAFALDAERTPLTSATTLFEQIGTADDLAKLLDDHAAQTLVQPVVLIADRFLPEPMRELALARGIPTEPPRFHASHALTLSATLPTISADALLPIYPREPDAVRLWRERHGE